LADFQVDRSGDIFVGIETFHSLLCSDTGVMNEEAQLKAALRTHLRTSSSSMLINFLMTNIQSRIFIQHLNDVCKCL